MAAPTRSPFPGMDPWMERRWGDLHASLAPMARAALNDVLPPGLYASAEERIVYADPPPGSGRPDAAVCESPAGAENGGEASGRGEAGLAVLDTVTVRAGPEAITEPYVHIYDEDGERLVTSVEFVSPTNKVDRRARRAFRAKRRRVMGAGANVVEIDLSRHGDRFRLWRPARVPAGLRGDYGAMIRRAGAAGRAEIGVIPLRAPLPAVRVPLRGGGESVLLEIQPMIDRIWHEGRYARTDYARWPDPPLAADDAAWAAERVAAWRATPAARAATPEGIDR